MVGSVGMTRGVSRPNSLIIQEALNLLSALGGDKEGATKQLLVEMKSVQDHNEIVIVEAKAELERVNQREVEVIEQEENLARELIRTEELYRLRLLDTINGEVELQRKADQAAVKISEANNNLSEREDQLREDKEKYQEIIRVDRIELAGREQALIGDKEALKVLVASTEGREEEIKNDRVSLDHLRALLDRLKLELDNRDARVLAAMEGKVVVGGE